MYKVKSKTYTRGSVHGSHKEDFRLAGRTARIKKGCDFSLSCEDDVMNELAEIDHRQARMLERGTGRLRKCKKCGEVVVNNGRNERMFGGLYNRNGFLCLYCRGIIKKLGRPTNKAKKKREIMRRLWDFYISRLN